MAETSKLKSRLEVATNISVLLVSLLVLTTYLWAYYASKAAPQPAAGLQRGKTIVQLPKDIFDESSKALLLALNTNCGYCTESVPFYNQLAKDQQVAGDPKITALFPNSASEVERFAQANGLKVKAISSVNFGGLNVSATPTLILVDRDGKIIDFWIGKLSEEGQQEVLRAIGNPSS